MTRNQVGARELKTRLGSYLRRVREGRTLIITERGEPVAELRPLPAKGTEAILARLEASGALSKPKYRRLKPFRRIEIRGRSAADMIIKGRRDRF